MNKCPAHPDAGVWDAPLGPRCPTCGLYLMPRKQSAEFEAATNDSDRVRILLAENEAVKMLLERVVSEISDCHGLSDEAADLVAKYTGFHP